eukprot:XP_011670668.1 PREDICTED: uncharacterized protein LOC105441334 [Strongylocentrotus purpuratus]
MLPRIVHDLTWNRTVNVNGGRGKCIPIDRCNEHFNCSLKGVLDHSRKLTPTNLQRASDLGGPLGNDLGTAAAVVTKRRTKRKKPFTNRELLSNFVKLFKERSLFDTLPRRSHFSFKDFRNATLIPEERKAVLKSKLLFYGAQLDWERPDIKQLEENLQDPLCDDLTNSDDATIPYDSSCNSSGTCSTSSTQKNPIIIALRLRFLLHFEKFFNGVDLRIAIVIVDFLPLRTVHRHHCASS